MIDFNPSQKQLMIQAFLRQFGTNQMRPAAIEADRKEHDKPWDIIKQVGVLLSSPMAAGLARHRADDPAEGTDAPGEKPGFGSSSSKGLSGVLFAEELAYGSAALML